MNEFNHDQDLSTEEQNKIEKIFDTINDDQALDQKNVETLNGEFKKIKLQMLNLTQASELHFNKSFDDRVKNDDKLKDSLKKANSSSDEKDNIKILQNLMSSCTNSLVQEKTTSNKDLIGNRLFSSILDKI